MTGNPNSRLRHPAIRLLLLLIALAALVLPSVAHGQNSANTPVTLVSNQLQTPDINATYSRDHGQAFTTGSETNGYTVTSVTIRSEDPNNDPIPLQICEVDDNTHPTADCWDLTEFTQPSPSCHGQDAPTFGGGGIQLGFDRPIVGVETAAAAPVYRSSGANLSFDRLDTPGRQADRKGVPTP